LCGKDYLQLGVRALRKVAAALLIRLRTKVACGCRLATRWRIGGPKLDMDAGCSAADCVGKRVIFLQLPGAEAWPAGESGDTWRSADKIVVWDAF